MESGGLAGHNGGRTIPKSGLPEKGKSACPQSFMKPDPASEAGTMPSPRVASPVTVPCSVQTEDSGTYGDIAPFFHPPTGFSMVFP